LSDEWLEEARRIRAEYDGKDTSVAQIVRMNLVVTGVPFGSAAMDTGHLEDPDLKVTIDYDTAKAILVEGNPQAALQALMAGRIRVEGDMTKLMAFQTAPPGAGSGAVEMATRLKEITE
jgi:hypothetical protein